MKKNESNHNINRKLKKFFESTKGKIVLFILFFLLASFIKYWSVVYGQDYILSGNFFLLILGCLIDFLPSVVSIGLALGIVYKLIGNYLKQEINKAEEEERKIEPDQHVIIRKHIDYDPETNTFSRKGEHFESDLKKHKNYFDEIGTMMQIKKVNPTLKVKQTRKNKYDDNDDFNKEALAIENYKNKVMNIANNNIFTNINGNVKLRVCEDTGKYHPMDVFVESNRMKLLGAHDNKENSDTIRLDDVKYNSKTDTLGLCLSRTTYFDMLSTNRALDYSLGETTLRKFYEYRKNLSPLKNSKLSNQIGITGAVLTNDGYILVEKRDYTKSTWRNKYGPSISLSLKEKDVVEKHGDIISTKVKGNYLEEKIVSAIKKTLKSNYGFLCDEDYKIVFKKNFMGVARDILEGGKPNFFFFVQLNYGAEKATVLMQKYASIAEKEGKRVPLKEGKINNNYYFVKYDELNIDYNYNLICSTNTIKVNRMLKPRVQKAKGKVEDIIRLKKEEKTEVADGLLTTLAYLELIIKYGNDNKRIIVK